MKRSFVVSLCATLSILTFGSHAQQPQQQHSRLHHYEQIQQTLPLLSTAIALPPLGVNVARMPFSSKPQELNQTVLEGNFRRAAHGSQQFSLDFVTEFANVIHTASQKANGHDFMISPFAIWMLMVILAEGANGSTFQELTSSLHIDENVSTLRNAFQQVQKLLIVNTTTIELATYNSLYTDINQPPSKEYERIVETYYSALLVPVDFRDPVKVTATINNDVKIATRGLIPYAVLPQDIANTNLFMISSLYFKGQWKSPFDPAKTVREPFYNDNDEPIGEVDMMFQEMHVKYAPMNELEGRVLELPYGKQNRLSMIIIQPKKGVPLINVYKNLSKVGLQSVLQHLETLSDGYEDEMVEVFLPRFDTTSDFAIRHVLERLGIKEIFSPSHANLTQISPNAFVKNIIHSTRIIVNEEGTTAAAVAAATLVDKSTPSRFYLNRPFMYLIVEKSTNIVLFSGQLVNPNGL